METLEKIKEDVISLNNKKNEYASKKINGQVSDTEEKELISRLIYLISELRKCALDMGVDEQGKIKQDINAQQETILRQLNQFTKDLKEQIIVIRENTPVQLIEIMKKGREELVKSEKEPVKETRKDAIKNRLKAKLSS